MAKPAAVMSAVTTESGAGGGATGYSLLGIIQPPEDAREVQFSSVTQSCTTLCNSMNCSMPGLPVHH